ncbi:PREDICTED: phosphatidylinositol N-acetylglucosaminyltransferase subunit P-like [Priapulus caudatus]|uniref:Phosphatidylinositol N-acetylglucosaminyltransferase subunit P n=1 Tax=Priapulus caudatus TaxID=37621 RepID=A0ABM1DZ90_PRICU|nr:PREDICTED: phosphatidylinositol N-acetylglucosaminyltransferase subunit P-like [Priapulus caudatus]
MSGEHAPLPSPERAIYGFALFLGCYITLGIYLLWAFIPYSWFQAIGLTYWPQKYWAIAVPSYACVAVVFAYVIFIGINFIHTPLLQSVSTFTDCHAVPPVGQDRLSPEAVPPMGDIDISTVCHILYLENADRPCMDTS